MRNTSRDDRNIADLAPGRTAYLDRGAGPPLVLVHGVGLNASVWMPQVADFASDHRVVAYDTLGHGASANPKPDADLPLYVDQLAALLDALFLEQVVVMGHSMGALIATLLAVEQPRRVACLIAANPVYRRPAAQLAASRARIRRIETEGPEAGLDEMLLRWFGGAAAPGAAHVEQVRRWIGQADPCGYAEAYRAFSEADPWLAGRLAGLSVPALFVTGALDPNSTPAMSRAMAREAPRGHACVLESERHMMAYASPDRFNTVIRDFLEQNETEREKPGAASDKQASQA